jgi:acetyl esterase/lipase
MPGTLSAARLRPVTTQNEQQPQAEDRSVMTRPAPEPQAVLRYGEHPDHVADLRLPAASTAAAPLVVVVHGGFWRAAFDRHHAASQAQALADAGYAVASIEYRRVGQDGGGYPGTLDDVAAALDAVPDLVADAAPGAVDVGRVVLVGHSAGGHLALWAAARHRLPPGSRWHRERDPALVGVVALAAVSDLVAAEGDGLGDDAVAAMLREPAADHPEADPARLLPTGVPTVLVHGTADVPVPVRQSLRMAAAAAEAGADLTLELVAGAGHIALIDPQSAAWPRVLSAVARASGR